MLRVYLGRFAPFHEGHKLLLNKLISKFGLENCLVLIGSSNVLDSRTPFKYQTRKKFIQKEFPYVRILPLKDLNNDEDWLRSIENLEERIGKKFIFYGGSKKDLKIPSQKFETHVLLNRLKEGRGISATKIRKSLSPNELDFKG
jgi:nicotinamide mononucleotide adenylyltransferase